jgi:hypothetical protein
MLPQEGCIVTTAAHRQPNLLLTGYADDDALPRPKLAEEWQTSIKSLRSYQYDPQNPLSFVMMAGKVHFIVRSAREFILRREQHKNRRRGGR